MEKQEKKNILWHKKLTWNSDLNIHEYNFIGNRAMSIYLHMTLVCFCVTTAEVATETMYMACKGLPGGASGKGPTCQRYETLIQSPSWEDPQGERGKPLQYSCLQNPMDRGAWWVIVQRVAKSQTRLKQVSTYTCMACKAYKVNHLVLYGKTLSTFIPYTLRVRFCSVMCSKKADMPGAEDKCHKGVGEGQAWRSMRSFRRRASHCHWLSTDKAALCLL